MVRCVTTNDALNREVKVGGGGGRSYELCGVI